MVNCRPIRRCLATLLSTTVGLVLVVSMAAPVSATTPRAAASTPASASRVCTVTATAFEHRGDTNVVTATTTACDSSTQAATPDTILSNVHVGYGCNGTSFTSTCWWFDVPSPGCSGGVSWAWSTISQNNVLSSWEAVNTCSHGNLYDLPFYTGTNITCYTCYSLGGMNNKTTSLKVFH